MRVPLVVGNWKMFTTSRESADLAAAIVRRLDGLHGIEVGVAPPFTSLSTVGPILAGSGVELVGQDLHWEDQGPYTGAVSHGMLEALGCRSVLVGHSERREHFSESDHQINRKIRAALRGGLRPILCVGEKEGERAAGRLREVIRRQVSRALEDVAPSSASEITVAYEPVWAIGTGKAASPEDAAEAHDVVRRQLDRLLGREPARRIRVLYGGSVTPQNAGGFAACPEVDGVLVGGSSLRAAEFTDIVHGGWEKRLPVG